jgi:hypothetical protein
MTKELEILKKKISSYRTEGGRLTKVSDELLGEILAAWEKWTGPGAGFYSAIGVDHRKMAGFLGRAKRLKREGKFSEDLFQEIRIDVAGSTMKSGCEAIEVVVEGKVIRFPRVDLLIEYLKKAA